VKAVTASPEFNLALFAMLVNLPWELWQIPFFGGMAERSHAEGVRLCSVAAVGDAFITLVSFWLVAFMARTWGWVLHPSRGQTLVFVACGIAVTATIELLAVHAGRWSYAHGMPTLPVLKIGVVPLAQWLVLPPNVLLLVRRQLHLRHR
jgi:hypothetical protein